MLHGFLEAVGRDLEPGILAVAVLGLLSAGVLVLLMSVRLIVHGMRRRFVSARKRRTRRRAISATGQFDRPEPVTGYKSG